MPVRGKILNCLKEDYPRIFKSEIIMDLLRVLGCGVEVNDRRMKNLGTFDLDNLNWSKVIICTDADVDGYHIRTLILAMLYRLVPTSSARVRLHRRIAAVRDQLQGEDLLRLHRS